MRYLVGFSADRGGLEALNLGIVLARSTGGSLVVCTLVPATWGHPSPARVDVEYANFLSQHAEKALASARAAVPEDVQADFLARSAPSASEGLLRTAEELDIDCIVMGSARSARTGFFSEGLATTDVLHSSRLPVVLTPRGYTATPASTVRRITCAISGSENSPLIASHAGDLAAAYNVGLRLATFIVRDKQMYPTGAGYDVENMVSNQFREQAKLAHQAIHAQWREPVVLTSAIGDGPNWKTALASVDWEDTELLVIGSSHLGPLARVFIGSNSGKIARYAPVPRLILPRITE